jgi:hypothetical protein
MKTCGTVVVEIAWYHQVIQNVRLHEFEILVVEGLRCGMPNLIIGRDLQPSLGLVMMGMPIQMPSKGQTIDEETLFSRKTTVNVNENESDVSDDDETELNVNDVAMEVTPVPTHMFAFRREDIWDGEQRDQMLVMLQPYIKRNQEIQYGSACTHPQAKVKVEVKKVGTKPPYVPNYPVPERFRKLVREILIEKEQKGYIERASHALIGNNPLCVAGKKENGKIPAVLEKKHIRLCTDMRKTNELVQDLKYESPKIQDILQRVQQMDLCSIIDLEDAYHVLFLYHEACNLYPIMNQRLPSRGGASFKVCISNLK